RVGNDDPEGCEALGSRDQRLMVAVCHFPEYGPTLVRVIPRGRYKHFEDPDALLRFLERPGSRGITAVLTLDQENVTVTYTGNDAFRVTLIRDALAGLDGS
ncbi:MAG TPA: hypothetical protein VFR32_12115, partial [Gaiellaceae bacterium]|nr:hypothetical protein [Gaiellaceae bacterium]